MAQGIGRERDEKIHATIRLKKNEGRLLRRLAAGFRGNGPFRSGVSQAVAALVRIGLRCILLHASDDTEIKPISEAEAQAHGLRAFEPKPGRDARLKRERRRIALEHPPSPWKKIH